MSEMGVRQTFVGETVLGKYELIKLLGEGGMGSVYLARHVGLKKVVAVKELKPGSNKRESIMRFRAEAINASAVDHDGIIKIHDIARTNDGRWFMVMDFLNGENLLERISRLGQKGIRISIGESLAIIIQVLTALSVVHEKGIVHRDMKPENIFLCGEGRLDRVKILDFGISKITNGSSSFRTQTGIIMGTSYYMSPEQARARRDVDQRADIWAVGVIMYELLAGRIPFGGGTVNEVIVNLVRREPESIRIFNRAVPYELEVIVMKALTKDRSKRYQTAKDMLDDIVRLQKLIVDVTSVAVVKRPVWRDKRMTVNTGSLVDLTDSIGEQDDDETLVDDSLARSLGLTVASLPGRENNIMTCMEARKSAVKPQPSNKKKTNMLFILLVIVCFLLLLFTYYSGCNFFGTESRADVMVQPEAEGIQTGGLISSQPDAGNAAAEKKRPPD